MDAGEAMDQHGMIVLVGHDLQELLDVDLRGHGLLVLRLPGAERQTEVVQDRLLAKNLFGMVGSRLIVARGVTKRDHALDAVILDHALEAVDGQLGAAIEHAFLDHVKVAKLMCVPGGVGQGHADDQAEDDARKGKTEKSWHGAIPEKSAKLPTLSCAQGTERDCSEMT